ncbi:DsbA family protein [Streptomyces sp. NPDC127084]|uniref:DsbA family protein n=1 Tax=Streptomyces sp. NPDC127084 TaxID=3347133 RepID=UPI003659F228
MSALRGSWRVGSARQQDGLGLGVQGTPTFFIDGRKIQLPQSYEAFKALDRELAP